MRQRTNDCVRRQGIDSAGLHHRTAGWRGQLALRLGSRKGRRYYLEFRKTSCTFCDVRVAYYRVIKVSLYVGPGQIITISGKTAWVMRRCGFLATGLEGWGGILPALDGKRKLLKLCYEARHSCQIL